ncbi:tetratricopeptide repeat protein 24 [Paramormyrops kingsleyae]|uniref:Tetratricopeptide repeat domain 24 n=1 Tax=Paramormyrops kingsleyae TaxID=1676925 RepID=A0A3B3SQS2_9TELE|nr:tetratricopeptide repeat protein 24 [Paramormyrops kingsleyae]XP_023657259.1 tetratricopeptide repeat protein 24 [Paramormyrops kingsleyae]
MTTSGEMKDEQKPEADTGPQSQLVRDIQGLTASGHDSLVQRNCVKAIDCFKKAFKASLALKDSRVQRACAFNLGAAYVESGKPQKGLDYLRRAQPGEGGERIADLQFNLGAAHEGLEDPGRAAKHYLKAAQLYRSQGEGGSEGDACMKLGHCYLLVQDWTQAAESFQRAGEGYRLAGRPDAAAPALREAADTMLRGDAFTTDDIIGTLTESLELSVGVGEEETLGKLYNDLGLNFTQLKLFPEAAECFNRALPLAQGRPCRLAAVLQNLGAVQNTLSQYQQALEYHQEAAALHGSLGSRSAQGQCFSNLAFALSQLGKLEEAAENYLHALQAFKDTDDPQGQWQACEGMGTVWSHLGDPERAILYYKQALAKCKDCPSSVQERLVDKLASSIQDRLSLQSQMTYDRGLTPAQPQRVLSEERSILHHGPQDRILHKQPSLRTTGVTSAKQSEPHWSRRDLQIHRPELQTRKEIPNGFMVRDNSLGVIPNGTVPERWRDQRVLGAARQDWDGKAPPLATDPRVRGPHPGLPKGHTALHEANRNLNNTYLKPVSRYQGPEYPEPNATQHRGHLYNPVELKTTEVNSNTFLGRSSETHVTKSLEEEETTPLHRKWKSQVCLVM